MTTVLTLASVDAIEQFLRDELGHGHVHEEVSTS